MEIWANFVEWLKDNADPIGAATNILTVGAAFWGVKTYRDAKKKEALERAVTAHAAANEKYIDYLRLCLDHEADNAFELSKEQIAKTQEHYPRLVIFAILISAMETAYIRYLLCGDGPRPEQWRGWEQYIDAWLRDERFRSAWDLLGVQYDEDFVVYVTKRLPPKPAVNLMPAA